MKYLCLFLLFAVSLVGISGVYAESITADLQDNLLRLHVIANSNSRRDQEIKLKVRDAILTASDGSTDTDMLNQVVQYTLEELGTEYMSGYYAVTFPQKLTKIYASPRAYIIV